MRIWSRLTAGIAAASLMILATPAVAQAGTANHGSLSCAAGSTVETWSSARGNIRHTQSSTLGTSERWWYYTGNDVHVQENTFGFRSITSGSAYASITEVPYSGRRCT